MICVFKYCIAFLSRKENEHNRLKTVLPDSEEEQQIKDKIADLNNKIKTVRYLTAKCLSIVSQMMLKIVLV